ncbi:MAG: hypothetical protein HY237_08040 [Acidobacteria bacterium]|nr:hypothetical protein [Acidobacteriota bacterium]
MMKIRKQALFAALVGLGVRLFFIWRFPGRADDVAVYEELARNWLDHHVYGLFLGGHLTPVDLRGPAYPAFLAAVYAVWGRSQLGVMLAQAALDLFTCFLAAALAARLAPRATRRRVSLAALWLAATCPVVAHYVAVPLTAVLGPCLSTLALLLLVYAAAGEEIDPDSVERPAMVSLGWFLCGLIVGLGALTRPETPILLVSAALVLAVRWRRRADWRKLVRAGVLLFIGLMLPLLPWAARNWRTLHEVRFLAPRYAEMRGEFVPRGFYGWTRTWLVRFGDVYLTIWKLENEPIRVEDLPAAAFDTVDERARVAALLERYNDEQTATPEWDGEFAELARERTTRLPLRTYLWVPLRRVATLWLTPRLELLPYSGHFRPLAQQWRDDRVDVSVTLGLGALNFLYVGLALAGTWRAADPTTLPRDSEDSRLRLSLALPIAFIVVRTAFLTTIETPEPRYVLECFPALLALAALAWAKRHASRAV